ncbi:MAG: hypothetical protein KKH01_02550 [Firmicutes bacterium]|jgi:hypothetical protein|nr:hypothetical protein [Bacillota bacterium]
MKITVNGKISEDAIKVILQSQKEKVKVIDEFCKQEKLEGLSYKDSELEYEYTKEIKQEKPKPKQVEVRADAKRD